MPVKSSGSADRPQPTAWPVPSCSSWTAIVDGPAELVGQLGDRGRDAVAVMAEHDHEVLRRHLGHRMQRVREHAAAGQRVQHLRGVRPHAGARPGRQDHDRGLADAVVISMPLPCDRDSSVPTVARQGSLRRQDSNLNYLNQNQRCCRLHHDGMLGSDSSRTR